MSFHQRFSLLLLLKSGLDSVRTLYIVLFLENLFLPAGKGQRV